MYIVKLEVHKEGSMFSVAAHDGDLMGLYVFSPEHTDLLLNTIGDLLKRTKPVLGNSIHFIDEDEGKKKKKGKK